MPKKLNLVINGASGKMGRQIIQCALQDGNFVLLGAVERATEPLLGQDIGEVIGAGRLGVNLVKNFEIAAKNADVIIDFSSPESSLEVLKFAAKNGISLVVGTTGFSPEQDEEFKKLEKKIRCVKSPNMSIGVNLLFKLLNMTATVLGDAYDVEVLEAHHHFKKDAPSGTAKKIIEVIAEALGLDPARDTVYSRRGLVGERKKREIGCFSVRAGDIVGDHTVLFAGAGERLELIHRAHSRETFARGALRAAKFIVNAKQGLYSMQDVLNIKNEY